MSDPIVFPGRPRVAVACGATLGEGAVWDERTGTLLFVDITAGRLWRWRPHEEAGLPLDLGEKVGFVCLTADPNVVVLGLKSGLARLDLRQGRPEVLVRPEPDRLGNRLNDGCAGPGGALYFGSMNDGEKGPTGSFYRWNGERLDRFGDPTVVTNGPAYDPVNHVLYAVDTTAGRVIRHALAPDGTPEAGETFIQFPEGAGHPDGPTVDAEGHLWVCHWGGSRVTRFAPDGTPVLEVALPTALVTKVAFGGPDLGTLYITTASAGRDREIDPMAGHVFAIETGVRGLPAGRAGLPE